MKPTSSIAIVLLVGLSLYALHVFTTVQWDGGKDVGLQILSEVPHSKIVSVGYRNDPHKGLSEYYRNFERGFDEPLSKVFGPGSFQRAEQSIDGSYSIHARSSGKRSFLWEYYKYWCDGFLIRVDLEDGRTFMFLEKINPDDPAPKINIHITESPFRFQSLWLGMSDPERSAKYIL